MSHNPLTMYCIIAIATIIPTKNTLAAKKLWPRLEKSYGMKSKGGGQSRCRMLLITLKYLILMVQDAKHLCHNVLWPGPSVSKFLM